MDSFILIFKKHPFWSVLSIAGFALILFFPVLIFIALFLGWLVEIKLTKDERQPQPTKYPVWKGPGKLNSDPFMSALQKRAYLQSPEWKHLKQQRLIVANHACEHCGCKDNLHLHHITYKRLGNEYLADLRIVCAPCHTAIHDKLGKDRITEYPLSVLKD